MQNKKNILRFNAPSNVLKSVHFKLIKRVWYHSLFAPLDQWAYYKCQLRLKEGQFIHVEMFKIQSNICF